MIAAVVLAAIFVLALFAQQRVFNAERREWSKERAQLISRIQHPEFVVAPPEVVIPDTELLITEPDDLDKVGTIQAVRTNGD